MNKKMFLFQSLRIQNILRKEKVNYSSKNFAPEQQNNFKSKTLRSTSYFEVWTKLD
jgi:hypothetical protein